MADYHHHPHADHHASTVGAGVDAFAEANKAHFDATAKGTVDPKWIEMARRSVTSAQYDAPQFNGRTARAGAAQRSAPTMRSTRTRRFSWTLRATSVRLYSPVVAERRDC